MHPRRHRKVGSCQTWSEAPKDSCLDENRLLQGGNNPKVNTNEQVEMAKDCEKGSDSLKEVKCAPCEEEGESKAAVKFCIDCNQSICQQCVSFHRRVKQIKDHKLVDQTNSSDLQCAQLFAQSLNCPNHQNKKIELMCKDHDVMCCLTCATVKHRNCSNVFEVADLAAENCMKTESQKYTEHLENAKQYIVDMIKLQDNQKEKLQADVDVSLPKKIKDIRRKVNAMLTSLEANIHVKSREMADEQYKRYASEKKKWKEQLYSVNENIKLLETVCQSGSNVHIFIALKRIQKKLFEIDHTIFDQGKTLALAQGINVEEESILTDLYESISYPEQLVCLSIGEAVFYLPNYEYKYQKDMPETQHENLVDDDGINKGKEDSTNISVEQLQRKLYIKDVSQSMYQYYEPQACGEFGSCDKSCKKQSSYECTEQSTYNMHFEASDYQNTNVKACENETATSYHPYYITPFSLYFAPKQ